MKYYKLKDDKNKSNFKYGFIADDMEHYLKDDFLAEIKDSDTGINYAESGKLLNIEHDLELMLETNEDSKYYRFKSLNKDELDTDFNYAGKMDYLLEPHYILEYKSESEETTEKIIINKWIIFKNDLIEITDIVQHLKTKLIYERKEKVEIEAEAVWSNPVAVNYRFKDYLSEQIRSRYAMLEKPKNGKSNVVMDSYLPKFLYENKMNITEVGNIKLSSSAVAVSPFIASILNCKAMELDQILLVLGYKRRDIKALMMKVKATHTNLVFVGTGGIGINTAYWLSELAKATNTHNLFNSINAFDKDELEISNLFRLPIDCRLSPTNSEYKTELIRPLLETLSNNVSIRRIWLGREEYLPTEIFNKEYDENGEVLSITTNPDYVLYGSPEIKARGELAEYGRLISPTHTENSADIFINPTAEVDIQVESYGMIQLSVFFMNQVKTAIKLLELLADENLDLDTKDQHIMSYSFDGSNALPTDRGYTWNIEKELTMMTEAQASQIQEGE